ncbi:hypothetical protein CDAR_559711 [Caerostris darwini]|uniref:Uncharacterized protein n=1 Tax=Caerostris darwini TaxID=1538125 RepID=A0AAV4W049_9ARAC|nr:hypothetical protein CDAR_559711 [Caerostris darwini]
MHNNFPDPYSLTYKINTIPDPKRLPLFHSLQSNTLSPAKPKIIISKLSRFKHNFPIPFHRPHPTPHPSSLPPPRKPKIIPYPFSVFINFRAQFRLQFHNTGGIRRRLSISH